jgi:nucleoside-diphosphate-sugar epimerase
LNKIILSGSTGFLGNIIINNLKHKYKIVELLNPETSKTLRLEQKVPVFREVYDMVIHCAGKAHSNSKNEIERNKFFEVNVIGTQNLLKGLDLVGAPKKFVFISSVAVYGKENGVSISENEKLNAKDPYGLSKIQAEKLIIDWCKKNQVICTILRLPLLVGKNPPGNLGDMIKAIKKGYYFNVGGGKAKKSMVLAQDVARFIPIITPIGGTYNLTDGNHPSFSALSFALSNKKIINLPLYFVKIIGYLGDILGEKALVNSIKIKKITSDLTFDDSKARGMGWKPQSVLEYLIHNDL